MSVSGNSPVVVRFGVFEADFRACELRKQGRRIKIQDLPFRALKILLTHSNSIVAREEFRQQLWPEDVFVDFDRAISSAIKRLRDALGDSADNPIFIETVDRRGYRWIAPVQAGELDPQPVTASVSETLAVPAVHPRSAGWKWASVVVLLALMFVAWNFRHGSRPARAALRQRPATAPFVQVHPANQEARDLYLQGRYYWNKRTPDDLRKAVDDFTQAIVHDPGYAAPYVGLADSYNLLREYTAMPANEAFPRALAAARKAVELDDQSSQAHASLAFASFWSTRDAILADHEFRRAVELDPTNATAHHWYATYLVSVNRRSDGLVEIDRAQALDPTSKSIVADRGSILWQIGRHEEALGLLRQLVNAEPGFCSPHRYLKEIYIESGDYPNYLAELKKEAVLTNDAAAVAVAAAAQKGYDTGGPHAMFESMFHEQQKFYSRGNLSPYTLAQTSALLRDKPETLKYLKAANDQHDELIMQLEHDWRFEFMNADADFRQLEAEGAHHIESLAQNIPPRH